MPGWPSSPKSIFVEHEAFLDTNVLLDGYFQRTGAASSDAVIARCNGVDGILLGTGISEFGREGGMGFQPMQVRNDAEVP